MAIKEFLNRGDFTSPSEAKELYGNAVRKSLNFSQYDSENVFEAVVLSSPIYLVDADLSSGRVSRKKTSEGEVAKMSKFAFKARIITSPSPHEYLPDPCDPAVAEDAAQATRIINMHTTFISPDDYSRSSNTLPKIGDVIFVELDDNIFSYNLQYGKFLALKTSATLADQGLLNLGAGCKSTMRDFYSGPVGGHIANPASSDCKKKSYLPPSKAGLEGTGSMKELLSFIAKGEGGYNASNQGTRGSAIINSCFGAAEATCTKGHYGKKLTEMTIKEIKTFQAKAYGTPQRLFAAGRYQIIPKTMIGAVRLAGLKDTDLFNEANQDKLGTALIKESKALKDYLDCKNGGSTSNLKSAHLAFAKIWASVPHPDTGCSAFPPANKSSHSIQEVQRALIKARKCS
tara:strand:+ start:497 stop:1699 length:1203 start_codon:yes stop_codon:yes gene_type:complete